MKPCSRDVYWLSVPNVPMFLPFKGEEDVDEDVDVGVVVGFGILNS
jgi:hypothetical protein